MGEGTGWGSKQEIKANNWLNKLDGLRSSKSIHGHSACWADSVTSPPPLLSQPVGPSPPPRALTPRRCGCSLRS